MERHEGVVLKAYRDPVGILTIGAGLTKASGVVDPKPGMRITQAEASALLAKALNRNYEPAVAKAMPGANQHEFDGGVSFHFNTGAIRRASWVKAWAVRNWPDTERRIKLWKKAAGQVLPGLVRRRQEEFLVIRSGNYHASPTIRPATKVNAKIVASIDFDELQEVRKGFELLGYAPGEDKTGIRASSVVRFQRDHDLTVDGIIGRATLSTLQRMMDARRKAKTVGQSTGAGGAGAGLAVPAGASVSDALLIGGGAIAVGLLAAAWIGWRYRDAVAVKVQNRFPKLADKLRGL